MAFDTPHRRAKFGSVPIRTVALAALIVQNALLVLTLHYSRTMPLVSGQRYFASTAVFLSEVVKFSFFLSMALYEIARSPQTPDTSTVSEISSALSRAVFTGDSWKLAIPAVLYTLQNSLQYVAAGNLSAATFATTYQLKILTTALAGVVLLGSKLDAKRWLSLALLLLGVAVVQTSTNLEQGRIPSIQDLREGVSFHSPRSIWELKVEGNEAAGQLNKRSATYEGIDEDFAAAYPRLNVTIGLIAASIACILSGIAGIYFEKIFKSRNHFKASIWVRNLQLSFYSLWPALFVGALFLDGEYIAKTGFFTGYTWVVWVVILLQALGGVIVAVCLDYADNTTKTLLTSVSALVVLLVSVLFLEAQTNIFYLFGTAATLSSAYLYGSGPSATKAQTAPPPPPINVSQYEKTEDANYFDVDSLTMSTNRNLRDSTKDALSTSRPGTPVSERRSLRSKSSDRLAKREQ